MKVSCNEIFVKRKDVKDIFENLPTTAYSSWHESDARQIAKLSLWAEFLLFPQ